MKRIIERCSGAIVEAMLSTEDVKRIRPIIDEFAPKLNAYLQSIGSIPQTIRGDSIGDGATDY